jgi:hypothetical protein
MGAALALAQVDGWTLATGGFDDGAPRVRDLELAEHLGYERPAKIRDLIRRLVSDGKLSCSEVFTMAGKTSGLGGRPGTEFWLTEAQALKVVAKSETDKADAILDEVIAVFIAVRGGQMAPPIQQAPDVSVTRFLESLVMKVVEASERMIEAHDRLSLRMQASLGASSIIASRDAAALKREVRAIAELWVAGKEAKTANSARRRIYNQIGSRLQWGMAGRPWAALPAQLWPQAMAELREIRNATEARIAARPDSQLVLFRGGKEG